VFSIAVFIVTLSVLIIVHEFGHFILAKRTGVRVERFSLGFGPRLVGIRRNETEYVISAIPLGGYVKLTGQEPNEELKNEPWEFMSKSIGARTLIILAGPLLNYLLGFVLFAGIFMIGSPTLTTEVGELIDGYPAKAAGLLQGDRVIAVDGTAVSRWDDMVEMLRKKLDGAPAKLDVRRGTQTVVIEIKPTVKETQDLLGKKVRVALIGIAPSQNVEMVAYSPARSIVMAAEKVYNLTVISCRALWAMALGRLSVRDSMTGPIGIFIITGKVAAMGIVHVLHFMGVLSVSLAIFNLLPVPVLDGGHMIFLALEKVRKKRLTPKTQEWATNFGLAVLVFLMIFVFYSDIVKFKIVDGALSLFRR